MRRTALRYAGLTLFAVPWVLLPFWMLIVNSFKTEGDASVLSMDLPRHWAAGDNYATVLRQGAYFLGLRNSLLIAVPTILAVLFLGSMAAWAYARSTSVTLRIAYFTTALSIILPPAVIPTVFILTRLHLNGSPLGYFLTLVGTRLGIVVFLATGFLRTIPQDFEDAAQIDGAGRWRTYWHIILPLLRPLLFTAAVMLVISVWNDLFFALFLLHGTDTATLPITLYRFASASTHGVRWNLVFAHVVLTSLPLLITYVVLQRRVVAGLTDGGVTG